MTQHIYHIVSSFNGHINDTPLAGFTKLNSEPGTIYSLIDANTNKTPQGLRFYQEQNSLIVEHNGKKILALRGFFLHKENPTKFVVDKATDGKAENIITVTDATVMDKDGCAYIVASESLLVVNPEPTANPAFTPVGTEEEPPADSTPKLETIKATGNTITFTYNEALDNDNLPEASAFAIQVIGGVNNPVIDVAISNFGNAIILTTADPIAQGSNFTIAYTDPTTGDDANAIQDKQGSDAIGFTTGIVVDGYIQGAQLYVDYNRNGIAEDDEILEGVVTDEFGRFFLPADIDAPLIAVGGTNTDTGIKNTLTMRAPKGTTVINPITTVVEQYLRSNPTKTKAEAETAVKGILGITDADLLPGTALSDYEPISSGNIKLQQIAAQIVEVAMQAESITEGSGNTVFENIAAAKAPLDLTKTDDVLSITKGTDITAQTVQALVTQTTNIKDADTIDEIATQQKGLIVTLTEDTGSKNDDFYSSIGTIEVTRKFAGNIQYSIDNGKTWTGEFTAQEGENTVQVREVDTEGNPLSETATFAFILDSIAPTVVITDNIEGTAMGDITYRFTFSEAATDFKVEDITISGGSKGHFSKVDDVTYQLIVTPNFGSTSPITVDVAADVVTDMAGNGNTAAVQSVQQVDTPKVGVYEVAISYDTGSSASDFITKTAPQIITAQLSSTLATVDKLYGSVNGGATWTDITDKVSGTMIIWDGITLIEGRNSIIFKMAELDGKDSINTGSQNYILDTKAPTQTVNNVVALSDDTGSNASDSVTKTASQTITAKLSSSLATDDLLYGSTDGGMTWENIAHTVTGEGTAISWTKSLSEGVNSIVFQVRDLAGNAAAISIPVLCALNTKAPTQTVDSVAISDDSGSSNSDFITNQTSQTITAQLSSVLETGDKLYGSVNDGATWADITDKVTGIVIIWDGAILIEGKNSIVFKITDWVDNDGINTGSKGYVLDTKAPTQTVDSVAISDDSGSSNSDFITNQTSQTITAKLSGALATGDILSGSVDGGTTWTDITDRATGTAISWDIDLIDGANSIVFKITDLAGKTGSQNYVLDTTAPTVTITDDSTMTSFFVPVHTFKFSEDIIGFTADTIIVNGGSKQWFSKIDDRTYQLIVKPNVGSETQVTVYIKNGVVTDIAGNSYVSSTEPTIIISRDLNSGYPEASGLAYYSVKFSEAVTDFTLTDINIIYGHVVKFINIDDRTYLLVVVVDLRLTKPVIINIGENVAKNANGEGNVAAVQLVDHIDVGMVTEVKISDDTGKSTTDLITKVASQTITAKLNIPLAEGEQLYALTAGGSNEWDSWIEITDKVTGTDISWNTNLFEGSGHGISFIRRKVMHNEIDSVMFPDFGYSPATAPIIYTLDTIAPTVATTDSGADPATGAVTYTFKFTEKVFGFTADSIEVTGGQKGTLETLTDNTYILTVTPPTGSTTPITAVVKEDGLLTDVAGNKFDNTIDRSIVIFDLTTGKSSTHSDRKFTDEVTDIYIIVYAEPSKLELDTAHRWWSSDGKLTAGIKVHMIASEGGKAITTVGGDPIDRSVKNSSYIAYTGKGHDVAGVAITSKGRFVQEIEPNVTTVTRLWMGQLVLTKGSFGGTIASGVLTSQGLI